MKYTINDILKEICKTDEGKKVVKEMFKDNKMEDRDAFIQIKKKNNGVATKLEGDALTLLILLNEVKKTILEKIGMNEDNVASLLETILVLREDNKND